MNRVSKKQRTIKTTGQPNGKSSVRNGQLERTVFESSRAAEYLRPDELQTMTGQAQDKFWAVFLKEACDNGMDAAEALGVAPEIRIDVRSKGGLLKLAVDDNGGGVTSELLKRILNFNTRTSDKAAYISPTRGHLGNAFKCLFGIPSALGSQEPVLIDSKGLRHSIRVWVDPSDEVRIDYAEPEIISNKGGTRITATLPWDEGRQADWQHWARGFALFNPHASVKIRTFDSRSKHANNGTPHSEKSAVFYRPTLKFPGEFHKFLPTDKTSAWWYDVDDLAKLVFAHSADARRGGKDKTLRDFVREFRGLSSTRTAKMICDRFPKVNHLSDFQGKDEVAALLEAMKENSKVPPADVLGCVGRDHFEKCFDEWYGIVVRDGKKRSWYKRASVEFENVPFVFEAFLAETENEGELFYGTNFSPTFGDPLADQLLDSDHNQFRTSSTFGAWGILRFLEQGHALRPSTAVAIHLTCPKLDFLDKGKTKLDLSQDKRKLIANTLWLVVRELYLEEERRQLDELRQEKRLEKHREERERGNQPKKMNQKEAVFMLMDEVVKKAAGKLGTVSAHTLFYQMRPAIQPYCTKVLKPVYFEQTLLPLYQREVHELPQIYYEPRGTLHEPHAHKELPLGTREVAAYQFPDYLYDKILFVEKTGLWPVLQASRLAEKYDMAICAGEGYATEACRVLFSKAEKNQKYQLFVSHDADPSGYEIARTLREETKRMPGYQVDVIDVGLVLADARAMGLETEEFTRMKELPKGLQLTDLEKEYFTGNKEIKYVKGKQKTVWTGCRRVELNAMSSDVFIDYLERKLAAAKIRGKVIPPKDVLRQRALGIYHGIINGITREAIASLLEAWDIETEIAKKFEKHVGHDKALGWIKKAFAANPHWSWDGAVSVKIHGILEKKRQDIEKAARASVIQSLKDARK